MRQLAIIAIVLFPLGFFGLGFWALAADTAFIRLWHNRTGQYLPGQKEWGDWMPGYGLQRYEVLFTRQADPELNRARTRALKRWGVLVCWMVVGMTVFIILIH